MTAARHDLTAGRRRGGSSGPAGRAARAAGRDGVMAKIGYARVSTRSQNDDSQFDDLTATAPLPQTGSHLRNAPT
jgi:hypothetical protein